jgi:hypothetical protein
MGDLSFGPYDQNVTRQMIQYSLRRAANHHPFDSPSALTIRTSHGR